MDKAFPGLVARSVKCLIPNVLLRPDISTHDCMLKAIGTDGKVTHEVFWIRTQTELDNWFWVCRRGSVLIQDSVCVCSPGITEEKKSESQR